LEGLAFEREQHRKRANACKDKIKTLKAKPQDEATKAEIDQFDRERQGALMLVKEINQRELLNTLTDAGLIPNYAFPEAGVELKSVLWRKKGSDDVGEGAYVALPAIKYERPASSAISEFAPENRFYANQRRVEVDQINMSLANLEDWRLCPACHHMELLGPQGEEHHHTDTHANCPRCGDAMWSNISQRRPLLRFKQAIANSDDTRVRIDDSAEDREPKFYTRQLLVDVDPADVRHAWRIRTDSLPFGLNLLRARISGILISASWARRVKTLRWRIRKASGRGSSCVAIAARCSCRRADQIAKRRSRIMRSIVKSAGRKMPQASLSACTCIANLARKHCVFWCPTHSLASTMRWFSRSLRLCN
jgi:hypothetical protein